MSYARTPPRRRLDRVDVVQPVLFAVMVSLAKVLDECGIVPDAVIGHSQGEIAAAYIAGVLSLAEAAKVVALRSAALAGLSGAGRDGFGAAGRQMSCARGCSAGATALSIAAINGPTHTIISGETAAVAQFIEACEREGIHIRPIAVDYASHSAQVEPLREQLLGDLAGLSPRPARVPLYSTVASAVSGDPLDTTTMDAGYWYANLREPVRFHEGVAGLLAVGECTFVELSAHPVLAPALTDTLAGVAGRTLSVVIPTLHRDRPDLDALGVALGRLHLHGHSPSWPALYPQAGTVELPTYPFEHRRYWLAPTPSADVSAAGLERAEHPLLGALTELADRDEIVLSGRLSTATQSWLTGHQVAGSVVFPATGFIDVILRAGECAGCPVIDELVLPTPLVLVEDAPTDVQITVGPADLSGRRVFSVHARTAAQQGSSAWVLHASGVLSADQSLVAGPLPVSQTGVQGIDVDSFYERLAAHGVGYGGPFRGVRGIGHDPTDPGVVYAEVELPADIEVTGYGMHPALLDAALHSLAAGFNHAAVGSEPVALRVPFAFSGIRLHATAARRLHVQLTATGTDSWRLVAADPTGAPVISIDTLSLRALSAALDRPGAPAAVNDSLLELLWPVLPEGFFPAPALSAASAPLSVVVTEDPDHLLGGLQQYPVYTEATDPALGQADLVVWVVPLPDPATKTDALQWVHAVTRRSLAWLQTWLARADTVDTHLVVVTRHAVSISAYDRAPDLAHAAVWALIHTAHNEHPGRITLIDTDDTTATELAVVNVLAALAAPARHAGEPQLAVRHGVAHIPRLARTLALTPPPSPSWQLMTTAKGDLAGLALVATEPSTVLGPGQIRVRVGAAGLNFRDVVVALGAIGDEGLGGEAAGVIIETAPDVTSVCPGDAVMGLFPHNAFALTAITDERMVVAIPAGWSLTAAASVPVAFLTAYIALVDIAGVSAGQNVLIHAGAGGVGQAAIQIAGYLGAQVFSTAHPTKHHVLEELGVPNSHIASSRDLDFLDAFREVTGGRGMDVVLNSLAGDFVDASLQLLGPGGCFVEIGKTDIRSPADIAAAHPGLTYQAYDLGGAPLDQLQRTWTVLAELFSAGVLKPLPTTSYGLTQAVRAFRDMSQARHTGKIVLTPPAVFDPDGTVLITGGTGMLGGIFAEHLLTGYGVRHLLLVSRSGPAAPGAGDLQQRLTGLGAQVSITAADTSNPAELAAALEALPAGHRLTAVIHTAGVLDDAVITELTGEQLDAVLAAKADSGWYLHQLTADMDLDAFIVFSSAAGVLGSPGQANYAAANAVLDALAHQRHHHQLPATSLAWGYWHTPSAMTAHLSSIDQTRLTRAGLTPLTTEQGLALFDAALTQQQPALIPSPLEHADTGWSGPPQRAAPDPVRADPQPPPGRHHQPPHPDHTTGPSNPPTTPAHPERPGHQRHRGGVGPSRPRRAGSRPARLKTSVSTR